MNVKGRTNLQGGFSRGKQTKETYRFRGDLSVGRKEDGGKDIP